MQVRGLFCAALTLAVLSACGGETARPVEPVAITTPAASSSAAASTAQTMDAGTRDSGPVYLTYDEVIVRRRWVEPLIPATIEEAKTWAKDPTSAADIMPATRHILIRVSKEAPAAEQARAKKKIDAALVRVQRGEDFAKVAREVSEDPGSKDNGGRFPGVAVNNFVLEYRTAYATLKPGEVTKQPVHTAFGWHVIRKEKIEDEEIVASYRHSKSQAVAGTLATQIAARKKGGGDSLSLDKAATAVVVELFGAVATPALADAAGPGVTHVGRIQATSAGLGSACEHTIAAVTPGVTVARVDADDGWVVLLARPETEADREHDHASDDIASTWQDVCASTELMSDHQLLELMRMLKEKQNPTP